MQPYGSTNPAHVPRTGSSATETSALFRFCGGVRCHINACRSFGSRTPSCNSWSRSTALSARQSGWVCAPSGYFSLVTSVSYSRWRAFPHGPAFIEHTRRAQEMYGEGDWFAITAFRWTDPRPHASSARADPPKTDRTRFDRFGAVATRAASHTRRVPASAPSVRHGRNRTRTRRLCARHRVVPAGLAAPRELGTRRVALTNTPLGLAYGARLLVIFFTPRSAATERRCCPRGRRADGTVQLRCAIHCAQLYLLRVRVRAVWEAWRRRWNGHLRRGVHVAGCSELALAAPILEWTVRGASAASRLSQRVDGSRRGRGRLSSVTIGRPCTRATSQR